MSGDASPMPVRRAIVSIAGDALASARAAITDDEGALRVHVAARRHLCHQREESGLAPRRVPVRPSPGGRVRELRWPLVKKRTVAVTMFRGAAVSGVLRHPNGAPVAGVNVYALPARALREGDRGQSEAVLRTIAVSSASTAWRQANTW
jgi:hypothetical protein